MGYTHYWNGGITPEEWTELLPIAKAIIEASDVPLQYEWDVASEPEVSDEVIHLNGVDDEGHEMFFLTPHPSTFSFCKTDEKPYDEVVVAILIAADTISPTFSWSSDGSGTDHDAGRTLYETALESVKGTESFENNP